MLMSARAEKLRLMDKTGFSLTSKVQDCSLFSKIKVPDSKSFPSQPSNPNLKGMTNGLSVFL